MAGKSPSEVFSSKDVVRSTTEESRRQIECIVLIPERVASVRRCLVVIKNKYSVNKNADDFGRQASRIAECHKVELSELIKLLGENRNELDSNLSTILFAQWNGRRVRKALGEWWREAGLL